MWRTSWRLIQLYSPNDLLNYGNVRALPGVDLGVRKGEISGFLDPNGVGETTTIRCLLDLDRSASGIIRVFDLDSQAEPVRIRARAGYLPSELQFNEDMKVEGNLRFLNRLKNGAAERKRVRSLAESNSFLICRLSLVFKRSSSGAGGWQTTIGMVCGAGGCCDRFCSAGLVAFRSQRSAC